MRARRVVLRPWIRQAGSCCCKVAGVSGHHREIVPECGRGDEAVSSRNGNALLLCAGGQFSPDACSPSVNAQNPWFVMLLNLAKPRLKFVPT